MRFAVIALGLLSACSLSSGTALARAPEAVTLRWQRGASAASCAERESIQRRVEERIGHAAFEERAARVLVVNVERDESGYLAHLYLDTRAGPRSKRTLRSSDSDCAALESAIVLAVAIAVDPAAALASPTQNADPPSSAFPVLETAETNAPSTTSTRAAPGPSHAPRVRSTLPRSVPRLSGTLRGLYTIGLLPGPAWGFALHVEREVAARFSVNFGLRVLPALQTDSGVYEFSFNGGALGACVTTAAPLDLCGGMLAGALYAVSSNDRGGRASQHPWLGLELGPRVAVRARGLVWEFGLSVGGALLAPRLRSDVEHLPQSPLEGTFFVGVGPTIP
ncbi:MAG TPA: hypothetical protein VK524_08230 [Polyangiaceae bacterium]|nr:hypothetical protein [Polyangiaceae bacterium]